MRRRPLLLIVVAAALPGLHACRDASVAPAAAPASQPAGKRRIALVMKTLTSPFFVEMEKGARRAEAELGIELLVKTAAQETSIEQQIAIIDQLTRAKVDAIVIAPGDSYRLIPGLRKAQQAGIAIVNVDNRLDPEASRKEGLGTVPFISVDNRKGVYGAAKYLAEGLRQPTQAAIIEGIRSASNAEDRKQGALQAFAENKLVSVVASESANWKIDDAHEVARKLFTEHPRIKLLVCANDMMALGAIRYLQQAKIRGVKVAGYDALDEARQAMREGWMAASVDQQAAQQGFMGVAYAARLLKGDKLPADTLLETKLITAKDLAPAAK
ncbi:substrate-binding domain-containing protein [Aquincola sp. S2]|uniref:Substrate-binding domain-containing protein n=1 Tax=Pseudaquabacterium terrae TaxID=2732868 RepID=A0ABX2EHK0_9BURK|nr:substrate-binding domain-containing protein [Aquabacterium terrae]NRF68104.1 substrate-binding domain-containing protein [Aquabacterium terrae]